MNIQRIFIALFLITGCAKSNPSDRSNSITYLSYEKYDYINNTYVPYSQLGLLESGVYFVVNKENCQDKTYKIDSKTVASNNDVHYDLSSIETTPSYNTCFADSISIDLTYLSDDSTNIYYSSTLFADEFHIFRKK